MTFQRLASLIAFACACGASISVAQAVQAPTGCAANSLAVVDLGAAASAFNVSGISGSLNNRDQVAGYVPGTNPVAQAAIYLSGGTIPLGTLGGTFSYALGVNNSLNIVGWSYLPGNATFHATSFSAQSPPLDLGTLGGSTSVATDVNNSGTVIGASTLPGDKQTHAVRFAKGGAVDLGTLGGSNSVANAVNNAGDAVGTAQLLGDNATHAVLYPHSGGAPIDLGTLGGSASAANGVNDRGLAVGYSTIPSNGPLHAVVFMSWAAPIDLGGVQSEARAINQAGDIVGYATFASGAHGGLWAYAGGTWTLADLNTLIDPSNGWTIDVAWAINDRGTIEASGHQSDLQEHTLLLVRCSVQ